MKLVKNYINSCWREVPSARGYPRDDGGVWIIEGHRRNETSIAT